MTESSREDREFYAAYIRANSGHYPHEHPVRMPNGVMDYLENGTDPVTLAEAECAAAAGDPDSYERAKAWHEDPNRPSSVRITGRSPLAVLAEWMGEED